jgi:hypothetical protein
MARVTASVYVRGVDAQAMLQVARERLEQLAGGPWTITDMSVSSESGMAISAAGMDEVATRDGMLPMWSGSVMAEAEVQEG